MQIISLTIDDRNIHPATKSIQNQVQLSWYLLMKGLYTIKRQNLFNLCDLLYNLYLDKCCPAI